MYYVYTYILTASSSFFKMRILKKTVTYILCLYIYIHWLPKAPFNEIVSAYLYIYIQTYMHVYKN